MLTQRPSSRSIFAWPSTVGAPTISLPVSNRLKIRRPKENSFHGVMSSRFLRQNKKNAPGERFPHHRDVTVQTEDLRCLKNKKVPGPHWSRRLHRQAPGHVVVPGQTYGSSAEFVGKTVFHRRLRRPRCSPSLKASLASSAAAPALTLGCAPRCRLVWAMGNGASGGGSGHGCRRPTEVGTGIFAVEQKNKVLCFNYLCAHRPLDCPQILRKRQTYYRWCRLERSRGISGVWAERSQGLEAGGS